MSSLRPVAVYGLTVPAGDEPIPAFDAGEYPATFKLTMAALDPFEKIEEVEGETPFKGATLRIIRIPSDDSDDEESDDDEYDMADLLDGINSEEDDEEDTVGGPSDPAKSSKARKMKLLKEALAGDDSMDVDVKASPKPSPKAKGKGKAVEEEVDEDEDDEDDDSEDDDEFDGPEEFVLCTLDPTKVSFSRSAKHITHSRLPIAELPADTRHYDQRARARLFPGFRNSLHLPYWKHHDPRGGRRLRLRG